MTSASAPSSPGPARRALWWRRPEQPSPRPIARRLDGRWVAALIVALFATLLYVSLQTGNPRRVWARFGVPSMGAMFEDLYPFPAAQKTLAEGGDIYRPMPAERWGRPYNYPPLWLTFMRFTPGAIPYVGVGMTVAWFLALGTISGRLSARQGVIIGALVCSPVVVLGLERGNTDVIIFALLAAGLVALRRGHTGAAWSGVVLAATLKLFPIFAFGCFLRLGWRRAWPWLAAAATGMAVMCFIQREEIRGVLRETPSGGVLTYGAGAWAYMASWAFAQTTHIRGAFTPVVLPSVLCGALLVTTAFVSGARRTPSSSSAGPEADPGLDAFRAGAGVFLATFLVGGHYVYRLMFLLLCVPWLARPGAQVDRDLALGRRLALGLVVTGMWLNPLWWDSCYIVRECLLWCLAGVMGWLVGRTLPGFSLPLWKGVSAGIATQPTGFFAVNPPSSAVSRMALLLGLIGLAALGGFFVLHGSLNADEGFYLTASRLVSEGLRPYRDFGFTQGPVLPFANLPWLELFGYDLAGQRLAGFGWTLCGVITGCVVLCRRGGWQVAGVFVVLLLAAPTWLAFAVKGKTYAFAGLAVFAGTVALVVPWALRVRWSVFILAAALGVGTRYPTVAFFAPAWAGLLALTPNWRARFGAAAATLACAGIVLTATAIGDWERFYFWSAGFHTLVTFNFPLGWRLLNFILFAPAVWVAVIWVTAAWRRGEGSAWMIALASLALGIAPNVLGRTTYSEYTAPFVPAAAFVAAAVVTRGFVRLPKLAAAIIIGLVLASGWIRPPGINWNLLQDANEASTFLRDHVPPGTLVASSVPEIPIGSGNPVPRTLAMGRFSVTEDFSAETAERLQMVTPDLLVAILRDPQTGAVALSSTPAANFLLSLPSGRWLSADARTRFREAVDQHYELAYSNETYVIFLRKSPPE